MEAAEMKTALAPMLNRTEIAYNDFIQTLITFGNIDHAEAVKVFGIYKKAKAIKYAHGAYHVAHGALLDEETIRYALEQS